MAVVDPQPHATSLSNVLRSERSWNLLTDQNLTKLVPSTVLPDDVVDAVERWDRVAKGCERRGQVVNPNILASSTSRLLAVVRWDRVS